MVDILYICRMFSSNPGLDPLEDSSISLVITTKSISTHCQMCPEQIDREIDRWVDGQWMEGRKDRRKEGRNYTLPPQLRTTALIKNIVNNSIIITYVIR